MAHIQTTCPFHIHTFCSYVPELNPEPVEDNTIKFTLITRRGNKQQVSILTTLAMFCCLPALLADVKGPFLCRLSVCLSECLSIILLWQICQENATWVPTNTPVWEWYRWGTRGVKFVYTNECKLDFKAGEQDSSMFKIWYMCCSRLSTHWKRKGSNMVR